MSSIIRIAYTITWDPPEVAGWPHLVDNGSTVYFQGDAIPIIEDLLDGLELKQSVSFGFFQEAFWLVANGSADLGALITSHDVAWMEFGLGEGFFFTHPLVRETSEAYFRQPLAESLRITMLRPFAVATWFAYFGFIVIVSLATASEILKQCISSDLILNVVQLINGRVKVASPTNGTFIWRIITNTVVSFFSVIMLSVYTAKIVAVLASSDELVKIPEDLLKYGYKLSSYSSVHIDRFFPNSESKHLTVHNVDLKSFSNIKNLVAKDKSDPREALLAHPDGFYPQAMVYLKYTSELCLVSKFKSKSKTPRSLYIKKDSPFRERINLKLLHLIERGLNFRHQKLLKEKFRFYCPYKRSAVSPLSIRHSSFAFLLLLSGGGVVLFIYLAENIYNTIFQNNLRYL